MGRKCCGLLYVIALTPMALDSASQPVHTHRQSQLGCLLTIYLLTALVTANRPMHEANCGLWTGQTVCRMGRGGAVGLYFRF